MKVAKIVRVPYNIPCKMKHLKSQYLYLGA